MRFLLIVLFSVFCSDARAEFSWDLAASFYERGVRPEAADLAGEPWRQTGGVSAASGDSAKLLGGTGEGRALGAPVSLAFSQTDVVYKKGDASSTASFRAEERDVVFRRLLSLGSASELYGEFRCRRLDRNLLCAVSFVATPPESAPAEVAPQLGRIVYYARFSREAAVAAAAAATTAGPGAAPAGQVKTVRCAMNWAAGGANSGERLTFQLLPRAIPLGSGYPFVGIGGSWSTDHPDVVDKVIVVKVDEEGGNAVYRVAKTSADFEFSPTFDFAMRVKNQHGLDMVGTLTVPSGGGNSTVRYPPGFNQDAEAYRKTLQTAPTQAYCQEGWSAPLEDPFADRAGVLR